MNPEKPNIEISLIGAILNKPDVLTHVYGMIEPEDFADPRAGVVYRAACELWRAQKPVALDTVFQAVSKIDPAWLANCTSSGYGANAKYYAEKIAEYGRIRRLRSGLEKMSKSNWFEAEDLLSELLHLYTKESGRGDKDPSIGSAVNRFRSVQEQNRQRGTIGVPTGFKCFEKKWIQYSPGHLWVIGAYTSTGKSTLMIEMLRRLICGYKSARVAVFSTEMTEEQNIARYLANRTSFGSHAILSGKLHENHWPQYREEEEQLSKSSLFIFDRIRRWTDIWAACRKLYLQGGLDVVFLDYVQNVQVDGCTSEYQRTKAVADGVEELAKQVKACFVCFSQIPNSAAKEDTGIMEYKGAGELAANADIGIWMKRHKEDNGTILLDIRKNRHGAKGKQVLRFSENWARLLEVDHVENE